MKENNTDFLLDIADENVSKEQIKEDWDLHFNDMLYDQGPFKVVHRGEEPVRFHEKQDAIDHFNSIESHAMLIFGERIARVK